MTQCQAWLCERLRSSNQHSFMYLRHLTEVVKQDFLEDSFRDLGCNAEVLGPSGKSFWELLLTELKLKVCLLEEKAATWKQKILSKRRYLVHWARTFKILGIILWERPVLQSCVLCRYALQRVIDARARNSAHPVVGHATYIDPQLSRERYIEELVLYVVSGLQYTASGLSYAAWTHCWGAVVAQLSFFRDVSRKVLT